MDRDAHIEQRPSTPDGPRGVWVNIDISDGAPRRLVFPDGHEEAIGVTLRAAREQFGGDNGVIVDAASGREHQVSLARWRDCDPDSTWVSFSFIELGTDCQTPGVVADHRRLAAAPTHRVAFIVIGDGDRDRPVTETKGSARTMGYTLRQLRKRVGGDEGFIRDAAGVSHKVSLRPWAQFDPDQTRLLVTFVKMPW
jgi:hypothetical protein